MTAIRIIGEQFSSTVAVGPAGPQLGEVLAAWAAGTPDGNGVIDLGTWLTYACATAETSAQTAATTVRTGFAADAPRGYSVDGVTWGLLVEPAVTNRQGEQDLSAWNTAGAPVLSPVADPAGGTDAWSVEDDAALATEYVYDTDALGGLGAHTLSCWVADVTATRADVYANEDGGVGQMALIEIAGPTTGWARYADSYAGAGAASDCEMYAVPAASGVGDTGTASYWGVQVEDRAYGTSFIGADNATFARAAGELSAIASAVTEAGYFDLELIFAPQFASGETAVDAVLLYFDADTYAYFRQSDRCVVLKAVDGSVVVVSAALTFAAGAELTVRLQYRPDRIAITVSGAAAGDGETVEDPGPPLPIPNSVGICSGAAGVTEGLVLYTVAAYRPIDGALCLPGWMRLDDGAPVGAGALTIAVGARVAIAAAAVAPDGLLRVTMVWRPSHDDSVDDVVLWLDTATLTYDTALSALVWTVDDGIVNAETLQSSPLSFAAHDEIEIEIEHNNNRRRISIDGVQVAADPLPPLVLPSEGYVLSDGDGSVYGGQLVSFAPHLQTFAELADERCLVQMGSDFRSWMQAAVADKARTFDALSGVRAAFDVEQAVGTQLDVIGSIVGLHREALDDAGYSVFLGIQIELLLAAARGGSEWTGTCENVLRIVRRFIGDAAPAIVLRNAPPYSYALTVEDLDYGDAFLLVRFLRTATHAGVLGLIVVTLADDSLWASDSVVVTSGGIWDSDSVAVPGATVWGTAISTA